MTEEHRLAINYRLRAEELRTLAALDDRPKTRGTLLDIATDYDQMARTLDAIDETNRALGKVRDSGDPIR